MQIPFNATILFVSSMLGSQPSIPLYESPLFESLLFESSIRESAQSERAGSPAAPRPSGAQAISAKALRAHVEFLASDELEGRGLGSPGLALAAAYLAEQLKAAGLEPAGDDGTFLQAVEFEEPVYAAQPEMSLVEDGGQRSALTYAVDFRVYRPAPGGKFDLLLLGEDSDLPEGLSPSTLLCFPDSRRGKVVRWLKEQGHPGAEGLAGIVTFMNREGEPTDQIPRSGRIALKSSGVVSQPLWLELSPEVRTKIVSGLVDSIEVNTHFEIKAVLSHNVIGRLPSKQDGARPELAKQAVVVSAHFDHIGMVKGEGRPGPNGEAPDLINNGADDDASGVSTILEIARVLAAEGPQEREVLFLIATAEEIGIIGTKYYLEHPSTPLERTVANLNFEMVGRPDPKAGGPGRLWLSGAERTNLMEAFLANEFMIVADPYPSQDFFTRSDNIEFCYRGIVGQTFSTFNLHNDYHRVTDEIELIDFEHMQSCAIAGLQAVRLVADGTIDPEWLPGGMPQPR